MSNLFHDVKQTRNGELVISAWPEADDLRSPFARRISPTPQLTTREGNEIALNTI